MRELLKESTVEAIRMTGTAVMFVLVFGEFALIALPGMNDTLRAMWDAHPVAVDLTGLALLAIMLVGLAFDG